MSQYDGEKKRAILKGLSELPIAPQFKIKAGRSNVNLWARTLGIKIVTKLDKKTGIVTAVRIV